MDNKRLLETVADISYIAGQTQYFSGDSRRDILEIIFWAKEFEEIHKNTNWDFEDYIMTINGFAINKLKEATLIS